MSSLFLLQQMALIHMYKCLASRAGGLTFSEIFFLEKSTRLISSTYMDSLTPF